MESNNKYSSTENVGGYSTHNLKDNPFFANPDKKLRLSFKIHDLTLLNDTELIKFEFNSKLICRIMKYIDDESNQPSLTLDIVDTIKNEIVAKADKIFYNGVGVGGFLSSHNYITQWEIMPMDKLCRSFIFGDKESFLQLIDEFNIKLSQSADWYIKNELE